MDSGKQEEIGNTNQWRGVSDEPDKPDFMSLVAPLNEAITKIGHHIDSAKFGDFLTLVDEYKVSVYDKLRHRISDGAAEILLLKIANLLVAKYEYLHRHTYLLSYPIGITLDPANGCNLHCPGCVHSSRQRAFQFLWPPGNLTVPSYQKFIQEYGPYAIKVDFFNYGEPLLNRLTPEFIKVASRYLLVTRVSTNLSLKKLDVDKLVLSGLYFLTLSIDGAHKETYSIYRRGGDFDLVLDNVRRLVAAKEKLNSYMPFLDWQFLVFQHNIHEVEHVKALAYCLGVNQVRFIKPFSVSWDDPSIVVDNSFEEEHFAYHCDLKSERDYYDNILADLDSQRIHRHFSQSWSERYRQTEESFSDTPRAVNPTCDWLYKNITMDGVGRIMPYCMPPGKDRNVVFSKIEYADKNSTSPHELFNSDYYVLSRLYFRDNDDYRMKSQGLKEGNRPFCSECSYWYPGSSSIVRVYLDRVRIYAALSEESKIYFGGLVIMWTGIR